MPVEGVYGYAFGTIARDLEWLAFDAQEERNSASMVIRSAQTMEWCAFICFRRTTLNITLGGSAVASPGS